MEEMEVWQPPSKHQHNGLLLPIYGLTVRPQVVLTQYAALKHFPSLEDCTVHSNDRYVREIA